MVKIGVNMNQNFQFSVFNFHSISKSQCFNIEALKIHWKLGIRNWKLPRLFIIVLLFCSAIVYLFTFRPLMAFAFSSQNFVIDDVSFGDAPVLITGETAPPVITSRSEEHTSELQSQS